MQTKLSLVAAALASLLMTGAAQAATTAELSITAQVTPSACSVATNGAVDFGDILAKDLLATNQTPLSSKQSSYNIQCQAPTLVALKFSDNRAASSTNVDRYGLGVDAAGNNIGHFIMDGEQQDLTVNGNVSPRFLTSDDNGASWNKTLTSDVEFSPGSRLISFQTFILSGEPANPTPVSSMQGDVWITPIIAPTSTLDTSRQINLDGLATMELVYF